MVNKRRRSPPQRSRSGTRPEQASQERSSIDGSAAPGGSPGYPRQVTLARANALKTLLASVGWIPVKSPRLTRVTDLPADLRVRVQATYATLGGLPSAAGRIRPGPYDLAFQHPDRGLVVVELDEEQHFTQWREQTLQQPWAGDVPWTEPYLRYCSESPHYRLHGHYWTSPASERMFGPADPPGDFTNMGSPRGRQRALYDAVKDLLPGPPLARVAVHDSVAGATVERILRGKAQDRQDELVSAVEARFSNRGPQT